MRMSINRSPLVLAAVFAVVAAAAVPPALAEPRESQLGVSLERDKKSPHWVHGQVDVGTEPSQIWTRLADVAEWPRTFSDIKWLKIKEKGSSRYRVRLETRTMDCGAHDYVISFDEKQRRISMQIDAPGIDSTARLIVRPGSGPAKANVAYSLYVRATGIVSWFVSEKELHRRQEEMVKRNLIDLQNTFGMPAKD